MSIFSKLKEKRKMKKEQAKLKANQEIHEIIGIGETDDLSEAVMEIDEKNNRFFDDLNKNKDYYISQNDYDTAYKYALNPRTAHMVIDLINLKHIREKGWGSEGPRSLWSKFINEPVNEENRLSDLDKLIFDLGNKSKSSYILNGKILGVYKEIHYQNNKKISETYHEWHGANDNITIDDFVFHKNATFKYNDNNNVRYVAVNRCLDEKELKECVASHPAKNTNTWIKDAVIQDYQKEVLDKLEAAEKAYKKRKGKTFTTIGTYERH